MISEMLSYGFIQRAFLGGMLVSLCAALLGVSLVLKTVVRDVTITPIANADAETIAIAASLRIFPSSASLKCTIH